MKKQLTIFVIIATAAVNSAEIDKKHLSTGIPISSHLQHVPPDARYAPYYIAGEKPVTDAGPSDLLIAGGKAARNSRLFWPWSHDHHDHFDWHYHYHGPREHGPEPVHMYGPGSGYEHGYQHGLRQGMHEGFHEGVDHGRPMGPFWG